MASHNSKVGLTTAKKEPLFLLGSLLSFWTDWVHKTTEIRFISQNFGELSKWKGKVGLFGEIILFTHCILHVDDSEVTKDVWMCNTVKGWLPIIPKLKKSLEFYFVPRCLSGHIGSTKRPISKKKGDYN